MGLLAFYVMGDPLAPLLSGHIQTGRRESEFAIEDAVGVLDALSGDLCGVTDFLKRAWKCVTATRCVDEHERSQSFYSVPCV